MDKLQISPENRGLWGVINFAFVVNGIMVIMLGVILPQIRDAHALSYTQAGIVFSAHQAGTFFAVLAMGVLPYLIGRKQSTLFMCGGAVIGLIIAVLSQNMYLLVLAFALTGICRGALNNICNVITADISGNRAAAMNVIHSGWAVGALISPLIAFVWISWAGANGWRFSSITVAALIAISCVLFFVAKLPPQPPKKKRGESLSFLHTANFWIPTMLLLFYVAAETSIIGWFVFYFIDVDTLPADFAGFVPTIHWTMMAIGRISVALIAGRIRNKSRALLFMALAATLCFAGMLVGASVSAIVTVVFLLGIGLSMAGIYPTTIATMEGATSPVSLGFTVAISGLGGVFMPGIIGAVADAHGIATGISLILAALFIIVLLVVLKIIKDRRANASQ
ncbi:MAG: MFS transporter [Clostridiales bacterium]|nr:MFS transporter [Clostridiales bacterium]